MFLQYAIEESIKTVSFAVVNELASKKTLSTGEGTQLPPAPPLLFAQWLASFQCPVPPTQYKFCGVGALTVKPVTLETATELLAVKTAPPVAFISCNKT